MRRCAATMDRLLADETILRILSYLDAADLVRLQSVSSHLRALAKDRHLWKRLFYHTFVQPRLAGSSTRDASSTILPTLRELRSLLLHQNLPSGRPVAGDGSRRIQRLPGRFYDQLQSQEGSDSSEYVAQELPSPMLERRTNVDDTSKDHLLDWEQLYRVSTNWQGGNFAVSQLLTSACREVAETKPSPISTPGQTIVRVSDNLIFTAAPASADDFSKSPSISVYPSETSRAGVSNAAPVHIPNDLHERVPIACFSSPGLRMLISKQVADTSLATVHVTEIAVDAASSADTILAHSSNRKRKDPNAESPSSLAVARVLVAYSSGHVSLFSLHQSHRIGQEVIEAREEVFYHPPSYAPGEHVCMAAIHSSVLVLCSSRFDISVFGVASSSGSTQLILIQRMSSYRCSWPAALRLKKLPFHNVSKRARHSSSSSSSQDRHMPSEREKEAAFRITLAYSTPSYPASWSVSVQEIVVRLDLDMEPRSPARITSRHATAKHPFRPTPIDLRGRSMLGGHLPRPSAATHASLTNPPLVATAVATGSTSSSQPRSRTTSLTYDDPFVVVGASDNLLEVYELLGATTFVRRDENADAASTMRSATATPVSRRKDLRLVHRRSLHGHTGSVHSVSLEDGRCVSGSADGSVMVWSLGDRSNETDSIASVMRNARATTRRDATGAGSTSSTILEDEEGDETSSHMTHVLTLRTPMELEHAEANLSQKLDSTHARPSRTQRHGPSLGQLVRSRVLDRQARGVIRWVSTAFDKIVSIVSYTDPSISSEHNRRAVEDPTFQRERVQVWSFG